MIIQAVSLKQNKTKHNSLPVPVSPSDLRVSGCYGLFIPGPNPRQVTMATLDRFTTLAVELAYTRALDEARGVAVQVGSEQLEVPTLSIRLSSHFPSLCLLSRHHPLLSSPVCQAVLSYSTHTGDRRTRVHTLTLRCSRHLQDTFRQFQAQTLLTFYCKKSEELYMVLTETKANQ